MSNLPFARRYWNRLTSADPSGSLPAAGRGRASYAFWQRYWAAFTAVDLPVQEQDRSLGGLGVPGPADDPARQFNRTSPGRYVVDGQEADVQLEAVPAGAGTFTVTVRTGLAGTRGGGITVWLEAQGRYFLTLLAGDGSGTFMGVPAGRWSLGFLPRPKNSPQDAVVALPLSLAAADLAAASDGAGTAILKVTLPDGRTELALHRQDAREYLLEVSIRDASTDPEVLMVRYGTADGGVQRVLIPVRGGVALARLPRYAPATAWTVSVPIPAAEVRSWDESVVRTSFRAAVGGRTKSAWRAIGAVTPQVQRVISEATDQEG
jgi:hypothetical protein